MHMACYYDAIVAIAMWLPIYFNLVYICMYDKTIIADCSVSVYTSALGWY